MLVACIYWNTVKNKDELSFYQAAELIQKLAKNQPLHKFLLLTNKVILNNLNWNSNVQIIQIESNGKLAKKLLEVIQFKKQIQLFQPQIIIHCNEIIPFKNSIPQILYFHLQSTKKEKSKCFNIQKIIVNHLHSKEQLIDDFEVEENKIEILHLPPSSGFKPLPLQETSIIKDSYADSREYFLYIITSENNEQFITVLKAFSQFKKWQKSSMKLIVVSRFTQLSNINKEKLDSYKFKEDVVIVEQPNDEQYAKILASAYATIYLSQNCNLNLPWFEILQTHQPLITSDLNEIKEIARDAALFVNDNNVDDVAAQMQSIYKDENLRSKLINKAKSIAEAHLQSNSIDKFWQIIQKAVQV
ncbi:MAG: glycosyltransferase [Chitinophagaceae bacterium]|nr:glycosyltransferase [Chitinophagaceae bacterium]